jgi:hypothetical protein
MREGNLLPKGAPAFCAARSRRAGGGTGVTEAAATCTGAADKGAGSGSAGRCSWPCDRMPMLLRAWHFAGLRRLPSTGPGALDAPVSRRRARSGHTRYYSYSPLRSAARIGRSIERRLPLVTATFTLPLPPAQRSRVPSRPHVGTIPLGRMTPMQPSAPSVISRQTGGQDGGDD